LMVSILGWSLGSLTPIFRIIIASYCLAVSCALLAAIFSLSLPSVKMESLEPALDVSILTVLAFISRLLFPLVAPV
jgi:hypothetical protein